MNPRGPAPIGVSTGRPARGRSGFEQAHDLYAGGKLAGALHACRTLLGREPHSADAWNLTGLVLAGLGERATAARFHRQAIEIDPSFVEAHNNLGSALCSVGRADEARRSFEQALRLRPLDPAAGDNLLLASLCCPEVDPAAIAERHLTWGRRFEQRIAPLPRVGRPGRSSPLRVGYVSADFRRHSVAWFLEPILTHHDRSRVRVHAYANLGGSGDEVTARLQSQVDVWCPIGTRTDLDVAQQIAADEIDVLVDLSGHTAGHRLGVFARRPAPVQVTYLGYPATTGLGRIDYRLTDAWADPPGTSERLHAEELVRLPGGFLCYGAPDLPYSEALPCLENGFVRFGSFNDLGKVSDWLLATWARILLAVPGSHLRLKARALDDGGARQRIAETLQRHGVEPARLEQGGWKADLPAHLGCYADVDVALDTFPYNGTTTTCEALWMGVPVVTRVGSAHVGRVGVSILQRAGLGELCASGEEDYVSRAVALAADRPRLQALRKEMRNRLRSGGLLDAARFVRELETTYERLSSRALMPGR